MAFKGHCDFLCVSHCTQELLVLHPVLSFLSLAVFDGLLILDMMIQRALIGCFLNGEPHWYRVSFPGFWYPVRAMLTNATIFMLVAVSAERFRAVCYPLSKRQVGSTCVATGPQHFKRILLT